MSNVKSRYKIFGGFGLILLIAIPNFLLIVLFIAKSKFALGEIVPGNSKDIVGSLFFVLWILIIVWLFTQVRLIMIDEEGISTMNLLFPFYRKHYRWSDFDYYVTVDERSNQGTYEAVWLIRNEKIKLRFSSFYYTNYEELKSQINTSWAGERQYNSFYQIFQLMRLAKVRKNIEE